MSLGQKHFIICPHCRCELMAKNFSRHCNKVHRKKVTGEEIATVISKMTNYSQAKAPIKLSKLQEIRRDELATDKFIEKIKKQPHKCLTQHCTIQIPYSEVYCNSCKQMMITSLREMSLRGGTNGCQLCGHPVLPNEDFCQEHLAD